MAAPPDLLRRVDLFDDLSDRDLKRVADSFKERNFASGDVIATEGQRGVGFFVISEGDGGRTPSDGERVGTGGPGGYFGEVALIDDGPRTATVTATSEVTAYGLTSWEFRPLVEENAEIAWELLQMMAKRLRAASGRELLPQLLPELDEIVRRPGRIAAEHPQGEPPGECPCLDHVLRRRTQRTPAAAQRRHNDGRRLPLPRGRIDRALAGDDQVVASRVEAEQVEDGVRAGNELCPERRQRRPEPAGRSRAWQVERTVRAARSP